MSLRCNVFSVTGVWPDEPDLDPRMRKFKQSGGAMDTSTSMYILITQNVKYVVN